jgi:hypothetical protein
MRFQTLFTLLFGSMSVASIFNSNTKISLLPYRAVRAAAVKIGHAVSPSLGAYMVCELENLACYGVGSIRDYISTVAETKCNIAYAVCIAIESAQLSSYAKLQACLSVC